MKQREKQNLRFGEAVVVASLFLTFILVYGLFTSKINFNQWPPYVEMRAAFWLPVVLCSIIYLIVLLNLYGRRKGDWKWHREGLISVIVVYIFWCNLTSVYDESMRSGERNKIGLPPP